MPRKGVEEVVVVVLGVRMGKKSLFLPEKHILTWLYISYVMHGVLGIMMGRILRI